ncbi:hypothetical protein [Thiohalophilus thiocyanatoxydans]|uniref:Uncharacterized protein n=1 Tax=Thiohalophilus thiocyanatoxydans TaxID=381308 RepID=A0A4R8ITH6_9GAMM|nr:hypothetical protein [Thiohalophilus thiocyanatoxydans]TDY00977.1 hypothetical protein EDC23_1723 [Thiohalophilus thiocyanatoxydans]
MSDKVAVMVNGQAEVEFDRNKPLTDLQKTYLDKMDQEMDKGIHLSGEAIAQPDQIQRAKFVANALLESIQSEDEPRIAATCSWLAVRLPELKQVRADLKDESFSIDLVFDQEHKNQVQVAFDPSASKSSFH